MNKTQKDIENINALFAKFNLSVTSYSEGTRVNQYRIKLPFDIDVNKLFRMQKNLIIALSDNGVIMRLDESELVIETKGNGNILRMNDVFYKSMYKRSNDFRLVLGNDLENHAITTSLPKAPHILVSGCTGAGKTQLLHSFIASLLLGAKAHHLILIDPKGNEFNVYKDIDTVEFIDNVNRAISTLKWLVDEMNNRYKEMAKEQITDVTKSRFTRIVCIIDEFADLMKTDKTIEQYVVLLAQKSRGCGIHLIIGTQYPKVDVITGLIQANIPTRICLRVNSNMQSRVAIERTGGEKLLGHGDMLFLGSQMLSPIRVQAPYISDEDKAHVVETAKRQLAGLGGYIIEKKKYANAPTQEPQRVSYDHLVHMYDAPQPKKVGFFQGLKNLWNAPQCTGTSGMLAMRTSRRGR